MIFVDVLNAVLIDPAINLFVLLTAFTGSAGIAVILLTCVIRALMLPLTLKQIRMTRVMSAIAPRMQEIHRANYDPKRRSEEQMRLYREMGVNPLGCFGSLPLEFLILTALYATFRLALDQSPEAVAALAGRLYPWSYLRDAIPLPPHFLWLNLSKPDQIIPVAVAISTYAYQKVSSLAPSDRSQAMQTNLMNMMMPLLFGWLALALPSAPGLYYVIWNLIGIALQYMYGGGRFNWRTFLGG